MKILFVAALALFMSQLSGAALAQMKLPPGSYKYTCMNCSFDGRYLNCACRTSGGQYFRSTLDWGGSGACRVGNRESQLYCEGPR